jgi:hypothetical protein
MVLGVKHLTVTDLFVFGRSGVRTKKNAFLRDVRAFWNSVKANLRTLASYNSSA